MPKRSTGYRNGPGWWMAINRLQNTETIFVDIVNAMTFSLYNVCIWCQQPSNVFLVITKINCHIDILGFFNPFLWHVLEYSFYADLMNAFHSILWAPSITWFARNSWIPSKRSTETTMRASPILKGIFVVVVFFASTLLCCNNSNETSHVLRTHLFGRYVPEQMFEEDGLIASETGSKLIFYLNCIYRTSVRALQWNSGKLLQLRCWKSLSRL